MTTANKILLVLFLTFCSYYIIDRIFQIKTTEIERVDEDERTLWGSLNIRLMEDEENTSPVCFPLQAVATTTTIGQPYFAKFIPDKPMTISELKSAIAKSTTSTTYINSVSSSEPVEMNFNDYRNSRSIFIRWKYVKANVNAVFLNGLKEDRLFPFVRKKDCDLLNWEYFLKLADGSGWGRKDYEEAKAKELQEDSWDWSLGREFKNYRKYIQKLGLKPIPPGSTIPKEDIFDEK